MSITIPVLASNEGVTVTLTEYDIIKNLQLSSDKELLLGTASLVWTKHGKLTGGSTTGILWTYSFGFYTITFSWHWN